MSYYKVHWMYGLIIVILAFKEHHANAQSALQIAGVK